jgi:hypothetical protein
LKFDKSFGQVWFKGKNIAYVKDKNSNFNRMTNALKSIINCESIGLEEIFQGSHYGHVFSNACQYGTTYEKMCRSFKYISIKFTHGISKSASFDPIFLGMVSRSWRKLVLKLVYILKN